MKKLSSTILVSFLILSGCQESDRHFPEVQNVSSLKNTDFVATLENKIDQNKNTIYSPSLLLAWDQLKQEVGPHIDVNVKSQDLYLLNQSNSYKEVLKDNEYSVSTNIFEERIVANAQFTKSLPFAEKLKSYNDKLTFSKTKVASFGANGHNHFQHRIIDVLYYENDNNFIVRLNPKDKEHQILLFMSSKIFDNLGEYYAALSTLMEKGKSDGKDDNRWWRSSFLDNDQLIIPKFSYNLLKDFDSLQGETFETKQMEYIIETAWQRTAFILDESGAEIESEALIEAATEGMEEQQPTPKKLIFDKPFFVFLARRDAKNPYFGMRVANSELMTTE